MKYLFCLLIPLVSGCYSQKKFDQAKLIQKSWCLVQGSGLDEINYGKIILDNNWQIELTSRADTIYFYRYKIEKGALVIIRAPDDIVRNPILKLTSDTLILASLLEKKSIQTYYHCR